MFLLLLFVAGICLLSKRFSLPELGLRSASSEPKVSGVVLAVYDGDTIKVRLEGGGEKRVRLIGVDAPEIDDKREDVNFWAYMAKRFAFFHLYKKEISLGYDWQTEDKYGRLLAYIWTEDQGLFNEFIIREGFAFAFHVFPFNKEYQDRFRKAEQEARASGKGVWSERFPLPISSGEAHRNLGKFLSIRFECSRIETKGRYIFLHSSEDEFQALIPRERISLFKDVEFYKNKRMTVTGIIDLYEGKPQVMVYFPRQIEVIQDAPCQDPIFNLCNHGN